MLDVIKPRVYSTTLFDRLGERCFLGLTNSKISDSVMSW